MDFVQIKEREAGSIKKPTLEVYPDFKVTRTKDIMVRGKEFYAIWDEEKGFWSTDEYDVQRLVDQEITKFQATDDGTREIHRKYLGNFSTNSWMQFRNYISHISNNYVQLDSQLTFADTPVKREDYVSMRLPYAMAPGDISAWDELVSTLYYPEERAKIEWMIGAIISGESKSIQKFFAFYGAPGTGKSTIINILQMMLGDEGGYWKKFEMAALVSGNSSFALTPFASNPLVAIEHDGDLSKVVDNSKLNSIVAHEPMDINEKFKAPYTIFPNTFLVFGTNKPVKITDAKSGLIRRLIDIHPTGKLFSPRKYQTLYNQVQFELGAIAQHCYDVYRSMGKNYYSGYQPIEMMLQTDVFFNFIEAHYELFTTQGGVTLKQAYELYKTYCDQSGLEHQMPMYKMRTELQNYFDKFQDRYDSPTGVTMRSWFSDFKADKFKSPVGSKEEHMFSLVLEETESLFDAEYADYPAQYAKDDGNPRYFWDDSVRMRFNEKSGKHEEFTPKHDQIVNTTLKDLDTSKEHYVKIPVNDIVIDFDITGDDGKKSAEANMAAAALWPPTYAEFSKSGAGIHLHYRYAGDATELSRVYGDGIEIKVYSGNSALRRRLSKANSVPIATLSPGSLPLKEKKVMNEEQVKSEKGLRALIVRNLLKEIHPGTKPSMDFIHKILEDAYKSGMTYDVSDMKGDILAFANNSTNQAIYCLKLVQTMKFQSEDVINDKPDEPVEERIAFYDVEVFPNLFLISWKYQGSKQIVRMINPTAAEVEQLLSLKLVGFNCRRYDNHILYGCLMGYNNEQLYKLSQRIISGEQSAMFGAAYGLSYADIYDFSSKKQGLKKFEIELGIHHMELGLPWDEPVDPKKWDLVGKYCDNDVIATEAVFEARKEDFIARQILADLSGLSINNTTQQHTARIVFGEDKKPQEKFVYTDLSEMFPGYKFAYNPDKKTSESTYRGEITGEGGYVYAEPGIHYNVALLDVASMHPTSIEELDLFGEYTKNFSEIKKVRIAIKRKDYETARQMLGGKLARYLSDPEQAEALSYALKIVINIVYGLTSAKFDNAFRDPRNIDNIVAKRGALFMIELKNFVQSRGFTVAHIKTDSIKIPNATPEIIDEVMEFGAQYGYEFEHEATYEKFCLVNDAVYVAYAAAGRKPAHWEAVGAQFQHPYVFKYLFSKEKLVFSDYCETKSTTSQMYLDFDNANVDELGSDIPMAFIDMSHINEQDVQSDIHKSMLFIGKTGLFVPIEPGMGGGTLLREKDKRWYAVTGTKGFQWLEAEMIQTLGKENQIDGAYFEKLVDDAIAQIDKFGSAEDFLDVSKNDHALAA